MGPQPILYIGMWYIFVEFTVLVAWDHWLFYTYILKGYPLYIECDLHGTTAYIIHGNGICFLDMHCVSFMGPLAILYKHFTGIPLIYSVLLAWDHSLQ